MRKYGAIDQSSGEELRRREQVMKKERTETNPNGGGGDRRRGSFATFGIRPGFSEKLQKFVKKLFVPLYQTAAAALTKLRYSNHT